MAAGRALVRAMSAAALSMASSVIASRSHSERLSRLSAAEVTSDELAALAAPTTALVSRSMTMATTVVEPMSSAR